MNTKNVTLPQPLPPIQPQINVNIDKDFWDQVKRDITEINDK